MSLASPEMPVVERMKSPGPRCNNSATTALYSAAMLSDLTSRTSYASPSPKSSAAKLSSRLDSSCSNSIGKGGGALRTFAADVCRGQPRVGLLQQLFNYHTDTAGQDAVGWLPLSGHGRRLRVFRSSDGATQARPLEDHRVSLLDRAIAAWAVFGRDTPEPKWLWAPLCLHVYVLVHIYPTTRALHSFGSVDACKLMPKTSTEHKLMLIAKMQNMTYDR